MERILIFIKHHLGFLWKIIDKINESLFHLLYKSRLDIQLPGVFNDLKKSDYFFRKLEITDLVALEKLLSDQPKNDLRYFKPHGFDLKSLNVQFLKPSFLMIGAFEGEKLVGYFFIRFFTNRKCFVGRLIDKEHRGKGIGVAMNYVMYETAWRMNFRCLSTISIKNDYIMHAHARNHQMVIIKELQNDYLLVEFVRREILTDLNVTP